jgi:asparagine synthase (glutamine-hydrolysing)
VAQLPIDAAPEDSVAVQIPGSPAEGMVLGESFILSQDVAHRDHDLMVSIIGEPGIVADSATGDISRITATDLLSLYDSHGREGLLQLQGRWAAIVVDRRQGRILLATDRMGRQPLYYRVSGNAVLVGSSLARLREHAADVGLDAQALYNYIYFHMVPAPGAVIDGFHKLGAAAVMELTRQGPHLSRYWVPDFDENRSVSKPTAHEELRTCLKRAVKRCISRDSREQNGGGASTNRDLKVGAFLSGGLDSSTVAGMLSEVQGGGADAYVIGFDAEGYDEMPFARLAARHFGVRLHEHYLTPDEVVQALPAIAAAFDEPFGNSSVLPAYFCARMAKRDGVDVLLAGDGGDELFAGNERYASQRVFEHYRRAPRWLRAGLIEPLVRSLPDNLPLVSKGRSFLRQANTPLPDRLQYYSFLEQNSPDDVFSSVFLQQVEQAIPLKLLNEIYQVPGHASALNRMLFLDWQVTLSDNDLRKVDQACAMVGIAVRYPMLDDDLVEFSSRIPSSWKLPGSGSKQVRLRHFYKQAMTGWLPEATIDKSKHGFGLPFGVWMKTYKPLQELAYDNILKLKERRIFLPQFLDKAIASHRDGHAAYFGELIWVLMSLELWLAVNESGYRMEQNP